VTNPYYEVSLLGVKLGTMQLQASTGLLLVEGKEVCALKCVLALLKPKTLNKSSGACVLS